MHKTWLCLGLLTAWDLSLCPACHASGTFHSLHCTMLPGWRAPCLLSLSLSQTPAQAVWKAGDRKGETGTHPFLVSWLTIHHHRH